MAELKNPFDLTGKLILITGASSGIGRATAIECAKMGATVLLSGRNEERLKDTLALMIRGNHTLLIGDLCNEEDVNHIISTLPPLDGVVLCAGVGLTVLLPFATKKKVEDLFSVNFFSQVEFFRLLVKKKLLKKNSSVVAIASVGGIKRHTLGNGIYGASKAALQSIMQNASHELKSKLIRVNCICPGMIETPLIHSGTISDEQLKLDMENLFGQHYGSPEDVAYGAIYLLSDAAKWVTGTSLFIDGGR